VAQQEQLRFTEAMMQARTAAAEERSKNAQAQCDAVVNKHAKAQEELAAIQAEARGKDDLIKQLEQQLTGQAERQRMTEQLDLANTERGRLEVAVRRAEHQLVEFKKELVERVTFAEHRCEQLTVLHDEAKDQVKHLGEQLTGSLEARAQLQESLAVATTERCNAAEMTRLAESRAAEHMEHRDAAFSERNRASEVAHAAHAEKTVLEAANTQLMKQVAVLQAEQGRLEEFLKESSHLQVALASKVRLDERTKPLRLRMA
jgi:chromosome segregation ATPase